MYLGKHLVVSLFPFLSWASGPVERTQAGAQVGVENRYSSQKVLEANADSPPWRKKKDLQVVPLLPEFGTGVIPAEYEIALAYAVGPYFTNPFLSAASDAAKNDTNSVASCNYIKCAGTVIKLSPCIAAAIACDCPAPLLACGLDFCGCLDCLPDTVVDFIRGTLGLCKSSTDHIPTIGQANPDGYLDFISYSPMSLRFLGYRGDLLQQTVNEIEAVGLCPLAPCGSCKCCAGLCPKIKGADKCIGECIYIPEEDLPHTEL